MSDDWQAANARRQAEQEAYHRAGIAQAEANRLQRRRDEEAGHARVWRNLEQQREQQAQELRQRQHQDLMRRSRPQQASGTYPKEKTSAWEALAGFVLLIVLIRLVWFGVNFMRARYGLTSSTREWMRADGTRMREDTMYGMDGFTVTSDRTYPDPDQKAHGNRSNGRASRVRRPGHGTRKTQRLRKTRSRRNR